MVIAVFLRLVMSLGRSLEKIEEVELLRSRREGGLALPA